MSDPSLKAIFDGLAVTRLELEAELADAHANAARLQDRIARLEERFLAQDGAMHFLLSCDDTLGTIPPLPAWAGGDAPDIGASGDDDPPLQIVENWDGPEPTLHNPLAPPESAGAYQVGVDFSTSPPTILPTTPVPPEWTADAWSLAPKEPPAGSPSSEPLPAPGPSEPDAGHAAPAPVDDPPAAAEGPANAMAVCAAVPDGQPDPAGPAGLAGVPAPAPVGPGYPDYPTWCAAMRLQHPGDDNGIPAYLLERQRHDLGQQAKCFPAPAPAAASSSQETTAHG